MKLSFLTRGVWLALMLTGLVLAAGLDVADGQRIVRFTGSATNAKAGVDPEVKIDLLRWSTDEERADTAAALTESGTEGLGEALAAAPTLGYVWTAESAGYSVRYAHRLPDPAGGARVIVATDLPVGSRNPLIWEPLGPADAPPADFTVIELRLGAGGQGEGRVSFGTGVIVEGTDGTIALDGYQGAPVLLENVGEEDS